jgi:XTP/dITP diphosphohydrolase
MTLARPGEILHESEGVIDGLIVDQPRGTNGFGYDPHFLVPSLGRTTAELDPDEKNRHSHRGQALRDMLRFLRAQADEL